MKPAIIISVVLYVCAPFVLFGKNVQRQKNYPVVGERCPDFTLSYIKQYSKPQATLNDFKGKWLLLDFWSKGCTGCIMAFPKVNALNDSFKKVLQVVLVGKSDNNLNKGIDKMYEKVRVMKGITLPAAFDSAIFEQFGIQGVPHMVLIDPNGIVKTVTYGDQINANKFRALLEGKPVTFMHKPSLHEEEETDSTKKNIGQPDEYPDMLLGSFLSRWKEGKKISYSTLRHSVHFNRGTFKLQGADLLELYKLAYIDRTSWLFGDSLYYRLSKFPVYELADATPFEYDWDTGKGLYDYYLRRPGETLTVPYLQEIMKQDLKQLFGYEVSIEKRKVPYWKLVASEAARKKLATQNGTKHFSYNFTGYKAVNMPVKVIISQILLDHHDREPVIADSTGITGNIDITFDALMTDFDDIKRELQRHGLRLEKDTMEMEVMVFRDAAKRK